MNSSPRKQTWLAAMSAFSLLFPSVALAGVVPYPKTDTAVTAFRPSAPLASAGQFSDASSIPQAVSGYGAGACVPVLVKATNTSNKTGDMRLTLVYPYEHGTQIGVNNLEGISATVSGDPQASVDNLTDLSFSGSGLGNVTSFKLDDGSTVSANVDGPYRGDNTGKSPLKNEAELRHYNVEIASVAPGRTVYVTSCARMSNNTNIIIDQYAIISVKLGGQDGGKAYIAKSPTVLPPSPKLTVTTSVVNNDGGSKTDADFATLVNGNPVTSGVANEFSPGSYVVSGTLDAGYTTTISGDCTAGGNVTLSYGDEKSCNIVHDDIPAPTGTLTVHMMVINDDGGVSAPENFPVTVNSLPVTLDVPTELTTGPYQVVQVNDSAYTTTFTGDCDVNGNVTVTSGGSKECTITNNDIPQTSLTVTTVVINDQGGANVVQDFPLFIDGNEVTSGQTLGVSAGVHVVTATEDPGYLLSYSGDCDALGNVNIAVGEQENCVVTQNDLPVGLTIVTKVINDNGGTAVPSDFTTFIQGVGVPFMIFQGSSEGTSIELGAGPYNVGQVLLDGYDAFFSSGCFGFINEGERLVCTITNVDL